MHPYHEAARPSGERVLTVFLPSGPLVVPGDHPNYDSILSESRAEVSDADAILAQADLSIAVAAEFQPLSERVSVAGGQVFFDGDPIHSALTRHILRAMDSGSDFQSLVNFYEKIASNPSAHSREQLYEWLDGREFTIDEDGDFYAYKGCALGTDGIATSINQGKAVVNGKPVQGAVPNPIGGIIEFPRSEVQFNPAVGCARGLHVGDYEYASGWARGVLLLVKVNPRDVVSVPTDCEAAKVRVSRYEVVSVYAAERQLSGAVYDQAEDPDDYEPSYEEACVCDNEFDCDCL